MMVGEHGNMTDGYEDVRIEQEIYCWSNNNFDGSEARTADNDTGSITASYYPWPGSMPRFRHTGNTNIIYCDGHVKATKVGDLVGASGWCTHIYGPAFTTTHSWYPYASGSFNGNCNQYLN
jgi:prepilin-type processing-associated H-X9-DG protein